MNFKRLIDIAIAMHPHFEHRFFHVTFALRKQRVVAIGVNKQDHTHPMTLRFGYRRRNDPGVVGVHSELSCILRLGQEDCSDTTFVNIRLNRSNGLALSAPCRGCQNLFKQVGFRRIFYSSGIIGTSDFEEWDIDSPYIVTRHDQNLNYV
jgi:hypothetical protein